VRAIVLVGGEGTRLRPLTLVIPKQLLPVAEVPLIERVLGGLATHGIDEVVLSMGYQPDAFLAAFPEDRCAGVRLRYAIEPEPLDTAGAIRFAARAAGLDNETVVVVNGDVLTRLDVTALIGFHRARNADATIALTRVDDPSMFGVVPTDDSGRVIAFVEKPPRDEAPTDLINAGTYVLEPSVIAGVPDGRRVSVERETFPGLVDRGRLFALASTAYWLDTGTPAKYLQANLDLLDGDGPPAPAAVERSPGLWTLGAAVVDGALIPPALVGDAAFVAAGASVERSIVGAGARVAANAVVRNSVLLPGASVSAGALVEGSIVGSEGAIGEGTQVVGLSVIGCRARVPAGERLDGEAVA
jgi:mannose-1-phosphate guanylyltransferase